MAGPMESRFPVGPEDATIDRTLRSTIEALNCWRRSFRWMRRLLALVVVRLTAPLGAAPHCAPARFENPV